MRNLVRAEPAEEAELDDACLALINCFEFFEGVVERDHLDVIDAFDEWAIEGDAGPGAASLGGLGGAGVVDQNAPDHARADGDEVGAGFPVGLALVDEAKKCLVDDGGGLEGVVGAFVAEVDGGEGAELVVDEGHQLSGGTDLALSDGTEALGRVGRVCWGLGVVGRVCHLLDVRMVRREGPVEPEGVNVV